MQNNKVLKKLLTVSAVAAMFSTFGVHAQTLASLDSPSMIGKTTIDGTGGNTDSQGMESRSNAADRSMESSGASSASGSSGAGSSEADEQSSSGTSGSGQSGAGTSGSSGSAAAGQSSSGSSATATGATASGATTSGSLSKDDQKILMDMARANIAEIEAGKLAQTKSQNDQVKSFAQQMIDDHSKALNEAQQVAQAKGVTLPTEPDSKHKQMAAKLEKMSGETFDKNYMAQAGLSDHKKVLAMLKKNAQRAKDPDVKALAEKMTPVVEQHLKAAQQMPSVKTGTTSGK